MSSFDIIPTIRYVKNKTLFIYKQTCTHIEESQKKSQIHFIHKFSDIKHNKFNGFPFP